MGHGTTIRGIPCFSLAFAGIFATLHHILWLPLALVLMATILLVETELEVGFERLEVRRRLGPVKLKSKSWKLEDMEGVVLAEYKGATQYTSHSQQNIIRAHSFILTARIRKGHGLEFEDVELFEFASQKKGREVLNALRAQHVPTS